MGKKIKKTRWRTLTLNGNQSDSEESSTKSSFQPSKNYQQHKYSKFTFSSQSTPIRKYQNDSSKTTRSNSTTSDHKTTFNEDEYTRITTPRQDVLFKKGYLNKPKNYQTQTSTGTSSTANSTSTCTPDHQSADGTEGTDLEYESQFVFPNGFIDQNGIYYINSFEPFPFVVYNAPICYSEYPPSRTKRYSTDSMTESLSPQNEEINSELSYNDSGERLNNTPVLNHHAYLQPTCYEINDTSNVECNSDEARKLKKKRRRKISRSKEASSESTSESDSSDEVENKQSSTLEIDHPVNETTGCADQSEESRPVTNEAQNLLLQSLTKSSDNDKEANAKYSLKPDAEEFIPRTLRAPEAIPFEANVQFLNFPPNFIPIPFVGDLQRLSSFPPGIPLNFVSHQDPNFVNIVPNNPSCSSKSCDQERDEQKVEVVDSKPSETEVKKSQSTKEIDIAKIVSKLEEAAKQQFNDKRQNFNRPPNKIRPSSSSQRPRYNRNYQETQHPDNKHQRNPVKQIKQQSKFSLQDQPKETKHPDTARVINDSVNSRIIENCSKTKDLKLETKTDYSDSLKKCKRYEQHNLESAEHKTPQKSPKPQNRWISVSSRKKRKNKSTNETQNVIDEIEDQEETFQNDEPDDLFESFDVDQLVDVVPEHHIEESIAPKETIETVVAAKIEEEVLPQIDPLKLKNKKSGDHKKKSKKGNQKAVTKRIMITDPNLEQPKEDINLKVRQEVVTVSPRPEIVEIQESPVANEIHQTSESDTVMNTPEKKSKKKKKKAIKPTLTKIQSVSSSNTTLSNLDDSYDFLLENSILEDFEKKTNMEISQELDRMIQKSMYSNLEEKIRALDIDDVDDGFFHAIGHNTPPSLEKPNTIKATDFGKILHNAAQLLNEPHHCENVDQNLIDLDFSSITLPDLESRPTTSKSGNFEHGNEANSENRMYDDGEIKGEPQNSTVDLNTKNLTASQNFSSHEVVPSEPQTGQVLLRSTPTNQDNMYPITTAVKDWMTKKREISPDVKILKSPNTILKELELENGNPRYSKLESRETSPTDSKIDSRVSSLTNDEEITVWSVSSVDKDLEDIDEIKGSLHDDQNGKVNGHVEEGEEAIEIYESLYGKNQDFLKLKAEIEEQQKSRRFPRHGNLPYRAICCSIM